MQHLEPRKRGSTPAVVPGAAPALAKAGVGGYIYIYISHDFPEVGETIPSVSQVITSKQLSMLLKGSKVVAKILWTPGNHGGKRHIVTNILETLFLSFRGLQYIYMYIYICIYICIYIYICEN